MDDVRSWVHDVPLAHRGLHGNGIPENSLAAFRAAVEAGVGIELDVRLTADGLPVIAHDLELSGSTGRVGRIDRIGAHELSTLRLVGTDEPVPTLRQALDLVAGRVPVMVEVKNETARAGLVEAATAAVLDERDGPLVMASFNPRTVAWFARHAPAVPRAQTGGSSDAVPRAAQRAMSWLTSRATGAPHLLSWNVQRLDAPVILAARASGLPVTCWTVRTLADLALARAGADNVIFEGLTPEQVRVHP